MLNKEEAALKRPGLRRGIGGASAAGVEAGQRPCCSCCVRCQRAAAVALPGFRKRELAACAVGGRLRWRCRGWAASGVVAGWAAAATVVATGVRSNKRTGDCFAAAIGCAVSVTKGAEQGGATTVLLAEPGG
ncbi:hypothetical protein C4D60_Mb05t16730 [Musa balbisiana]|uniref:Uncharacterized protein n=1 Tax=Musa balbisiana TaxID=52838 RepID=A0A4S8JWN3_MUSBA|nr:hypothetical protein C4D60_Mb05t16730 [Musa balbisiana]